ncbi:unnamed protein product [Candidatus Protochlamydia amoebophila UWE25]|uniref:DUF2878 domain-containing protein n=1 Tax=Protochlamydia amoebophila (strain UWE25) TaxID=264201 RepID=A0A2P9H9Q1_PARUW|nr:unnamed protein product [Candidatus Protochlamydia amoebophila UWE25]
MDHNVLLPFLDRAISTALFYGGWCWCLNDAAHNHTHYYGFWFVLFIIIYQIYRSNSRKADFLLVCFICLLGPLSDALYVQFGLINYHHSFHSIIWLPPVWIFLLWALVAVNLPLFSWLNQRWVLAAVLGAFGGPLSYFSAIRLGSISLLKPLPLTLMILGGVWLILFPCLLWLSNKFKQWFAARHSECP